MDTIEGFRQLLASRLIQILGPLALAAPGIASGCGGNVVVDPAGVTGDGGAGGAPVSSSSTANGSTCAVTTATSGTTTASSSASTASGNQPVYDCFPWTADAPCPSAPEALPYFEQLNCTDPDYTYTYQVVDGPFEEPGQCCYHVYQDFCGVGRPFLSDGRPLAAEARTGGPGGAWTAQRVTPCLDSLTGDEREALAAAWARDGLLEHASVASFARFSLDLLAVGAPADLLEAAHAAALDEVRHARLCFALASAYRGAPVEPGPFPCGETVRVESSLTALAVAAVHEGCIGETISAILAAEQLARATDPAVRDVLATIAQDEARHAELAFRAVSWAIRVGGEPVRAAVAAAFDQAAQQGAAVAIEDGEVGGALEAHGRIHAADARVAAASALVEVVLPSGRAMLAASAPLKDSRFADQV
jgi:hypothetical protein